MTERVAPPLRLSIGYSATWVDSVFNYLAGERALRYWVRRSWPTDARVAEILPTLGERGWQVEATGESPMREEAVASSPTRERRSGGDLVYLLRSEGHLNVEVFAQDGEALPGIEKELRDAVPEPEERPDTVRATFWYWDGHAPGNVSRTISVEPWERVRGNYPARVAGALAAEVADKPREGQVMVWHGEPGTGKTWAIRALAWEWREWADLHVVVDPEQMFTDKPAYLVSTLLGGDAEPSSGDGRGPRWKLVVLEDAGDMVKADARQRTGQGLPRLLNLTDGLIGQGLKIAVLITTNDDELVLDKALTRVGRARRPIKFERFEARDAAAWLREHDAGTVSGDGGTLAELYARVAGEVREPERVAPGFAR